MRILACLLLAAAACLGSHAACATPPQDGAVERGATPVATAVDPARRVALVIGNGDYPGQKLANPVRDAQAIEVALRSLDFTVVAAINATRTEMLTALTRFRSSLRGAGVGLVYFAGHGVQIDGQNFLIPVDVDMKREEQVRYNSIRVDDVLEGLDVQGTPPVKILILDACRNNPFGRARGAGGSGLAPVNLAPKGTLIAYATAPGRTADDGEPGRNGLYTAELLRALSEPGYSIEDVFKLTRARVAEATRGRQIPWESTSLTGHVVLRAGRSSASISDIPNAGVRPGPVASTSGEVSGGTRGASQPAGESFSPRPARPLPMTRFQDCERCPPMIVIPAGVFQMGARADEIGRQEIEFPEQTISLARPIAVGRFEVTFDEWMQCLLDRGCDRWPADFGWGRQRRPVVDVSWDDAQHYVKWLSKRTGFNYRLPSEAEWEYAARAGTVSTRPWGDELRGTEAQCRDCNAMTQAGRSIEVGHFPANAWGLNDVLGNVWELVADCYMPTLAGLPPDGAARSDGDCSRRIVRGGSWATSAAGLRSAVRSVFPAGRRDRAVGFRVVTDLQ